MALRIGTQVWVPCEVKPGPFSDERLVRIRSNRGEWLGFVPIHGLREPILEGATFIGARVVAVNGEWFKASLPGEALTPSLFEGDADTVLERFTTQQSLDEEMEELERLSSYGDSRGWKFNRDEIYDL